MESCSSTLISRKFVSADVTGRNFAKNAIIRPDIVWIFIAVRDVVPLVSSSILFPPLSQIGLIKSPLFRGNCRNSGRTQLNLVCGAQERSQTVPLFHQRQLRQFESNAARSSVFAQTWVMQLRATDVRLRRVELGREERLVLSRKMIYHTWGHVLGVGRIFVRLVWDFLKKLFLISNFTKENVIF